MKGPIDFIIYSITSFLLLSCDQQEKKVTYARIIRDIPVSNKINYPDGKIHLMITYQHGALSEIQYFSHSGKYDSIAYYKRGQKNSVVNYRYDDNSNYRKLTFSNGDLISTEKYDSDNNLLYKEPISLKDHPYSEFLFKSRRTYLDRNYTDTLFITNKSLPVLNRAFRFVNFVPLRIGPSNISEYVIKARSIKSGVKNIQILMYLHQQNERQKLMDSLVIPVK